MEHTEIASRRQVGRPEWTTLKETLEERAPAVLSVGEAVSYLPAQTSLVAMESQSELSPRRSDPRPLPSLTHVTATLGR